MAPRRVLGDISSAHITSVACGFAHMVVLDTHGYVYTCGNNKYGQLGLAFTHNVRMRREEEEEEEDVVDEKKMRVNAHERVFTLHGVQQHNDMVSGSITMYADDECHDVC